MTTTRKLPTGPDNRDWGPAATLLNRENAIPADGWYHLVPKGEFVNRDVEGRVWIQVIDDEAIEAMASQLPDTLDILVDRDHFSHDSSRETRAAGWIKAKEVRDDGLWVRIEWTPSGQSDVEGREYRYLSPEFPPAGLERLGGKRIRPRLLDGAAITNRHALKSLKPLLNREGTTHNQDTLPMDNLLIRLRSFLKLGTDADEAAILNRLNETESTFDDLLAADGDAADLRNRVTALSTELADATLAEYADVISDPAKIRPALINNRASTLEFLQGLKKPEGGDPPAAPIYNRSQAKAPDGTAAKLDKAAAAEEARASRINNRAAEIQRAEKCGFHIAWAKAETEEPAAE